MWKPGFRKFSHVGHARRGKGARAAYVQGLLRHST